MNGKNNKSQMEVKMLSKEYLQKMVDRSYEIGVLREKRIKDVFAA
jgi:hypothetical protein